MIYPSLPLSVPLVCGVVVGNQTNFSDSHLCSLLSCGGGISRSSCEVVLVKNSGDVVLPQSEGAS